MRENQNVEKFTKSFNATFKGKEICDQYLNLEIDEYMNFSSKEIRALLWHRLSNMEISKPDKPDIEDEGEYKLEEAV